MNKQLATVEAYLARTLEGARDVLESSETFENSSEVRVELQGRVDGLEDALRIVRDVRDFGTRSFEEAALTRRRHD